MEDKKIFGFQNRILRVNLTNHTSTVEEPEDVASLLTTYIKKFPSEPTHWVLITKLFLLLGHSQALAL